MFVCVCVRVWCRRKTVLSGKIKDQCLLPEALFTRLQFRLALDKSSSPDCCFCGAVHFPIIMCYSAYCGRNNHTHTHTHTHTLKPSMAFHATVTPSGLALVALYSAIKKAIILFKGIYHFRGGRGVSTLGFSKRGRVQSIRSIPQVSLAFHQTGKSRSGLSFLAGKCKSMCVREETSSGTVLTAPPSFSG